QAAAPGGAEKAKAAALKGTMIGVAPPDLQTAIAEARQAGAAQQAPQARQAAARPGPASDPDNPFAKPPPSQLKRTMLGVDPPEMQRAIAAARQRLASSKLGSDDTRPPDAPPGGAGIGAGPLGSTMTAGGGQQAREQQAREQQAASDVNAFGGTVVG